MATFAALWKKHVGRAFVCDVNTFPNQCAMRMGAALESSGISLAGKKLPRCSHYSDKFKSHKPGHIRSAQELANVFYRNPTLLGAGVRKQIFNGSINANMAQLKKTGMIFIMNGWGNTDHIDLWDGKKKELRGGDSSYFNVGKQVWFWELK